MMEERVCSMAPINQPFWQESLASLNLIDDWAVHPVYDHLRLWPGRACHPWDRCCQEWISTWRQSQPSGL